MINFIRLATIQRILVKYGIDKMLFAANLLPPAMYLLYLSPFTWVKRVEGERGEKIRLALIELGPIFVKLGQMLSTRRDLLPDDIATELTKLQDKVPPFSAAQSKQIIESSAKSTVDKMFKAFEPEPFAAASIAQVHAATLVDGTEVVVKVVRPNVKQQIDHDMNLVQSVAAILERYSKLARQLHLKEVVNDYQKVLLDELDMMREGASLSQVKRNFAEREGLILPSVHWGYSNQNVLVMDRVKGVPIGETNTLRQLGVNMQRLAELGVEIFFTQVFQDNFFHADMHSGNIFVDVTSLNEPKFVAVDFGIVGSLNKDDQRYLAENFLAFFNRDYRKIAELHLKSGWIPADTRVEEFEAAIRTVSEPIFARPLAEISFGHFLLRLFQVGRRFSMEVQPQLILLQKTLLYIEGLGRQLYPELDLWQTAKPFLERWMKNRTSAKTVLKELQEQAPILVELLVRLPELSYAALQEAAKENSKNS